MRSPEPNPHTKIIREDEIPTGEPVTVTPAAAATRNPEMQAASVDPDATLEIPVPVPQATPETPITAARTNEEYEKELDHPTKYTFYEQPERIAEFIQNLDRFHTIDDFYNECTTDGHAIGILFLNADGRVVDRNLFPNRIKSEFDAIVEQAKQTPLEAQQQFIDQHIQQCDLPYIANYKIREAFVRLFKRSLEKAKHVIDRETRQKQEKQTGLEKHVQESYVLFTTNLTQFQSLCETNQLSIDYINEYLNNIQTSVDSIQDTYAELQNQPTNLTPFDTTFSAKAEKDGVVTVIGTMNVHLEYNTDQKRIVLKHHFVPVAPEHTTEV